MCICIDFIPKWCLRTGQIKSGEKAGYKEVSKKKNGALTKISQSNK